MWNRAKTIFLTSVAPSQSSVFLGARWYHPALLIPATMDNVFSKKSPSRQRCRGDDDEDEGSKKPRAKKIRSLGGIDGSSGAEETSSTLPLDAFMVVMEFLHPRVRVFYSSLISPIIAL
jgi:hypothetical protein